MNSASIAATSARDRDMGRTPKPAVVGNAPAAWAGPRGWVSTRTILRGHHQRPTVRLLAVGLSAVGYTLLAVVLLQHGIYSDGGLGGGDIFAYWMAGSHITEGAPVYGAGVGAYAAFFYPPPFAQLFAPLALLPFPVVVWVWRAVELACLRVAVGSWTTAGIALLVWPPVIAEIDAGNVHLVIAAAVALAMRGDARTVVPAALTKFASLAVLPLAFVTDRRGLTLGIGLALLAVLLSAALAPDLWSAYAAFLPVVPNGNEGAYNIGAGVPLVLRLGLAALVSIAAIRWVRLAPVAALLAMPILWVHSLSVLVAIASPADGALSRVAHPRAPRVPGSRLRGRDPAAPVSAPPARRGMPDRTFAGGRHGRRDRLLKRALATSLR